MAPVHVHVHEPEPLTVLVLECSLWNERAFTRAPRPISDPSASPLLDLYVWPNCAKLNSLHHQSKPSPSPSPSRNNVCVVTFRARPLLNARACPVISTGVPMTLTEAKEFAEKAATQLAPLPFASALAEALAEAKRVVDVDAARRANKAGAAHPNAHVVLSIASPTWERDATAATNQAAAALTAAGVSLSVVAPNMQANVWEAMQSLLGLKDSTDVAAKGVAPGHLVLLSRRWVNEAEIVHRPPGTSKTQTVAPHTPSPDTVLQPTTNSGPLAAIPTSAPAPAPAFAAGAAGAMPQTQTQPPRVSAHWSGKLILEPNAVASQPQEVELWAMQAIGADAASVADLARFPAQLRVTAERQFVKKEKVVEWCQQPRKKAQIHIPQTGLTSHGGAYVQTMMKNSYSLMISPPSAGANPIFLLIETVKDPSTQKPGNRLYAYW